MDDSDPFIEEMLKAIEEGPDPEWEPWYAEHGHGPSVVFKGPNGGIGIPSFMDSMRFGVFKEKGLEAMYAFDLEMREYLAAMRAEIEANPEAKAKYLIPVDRLEES